MKVKIYIKLFLLLALNSVYAQVGIGTSSPNGALDINSSTNGVVVPNVALTSRATAAPIVNPNGGGAPIAGTLVWNTQTAGSAPNNVTPGFYYWDGAAWIAIAGDGGKNWTTSGNAGTTSAANFFGTTDDIDLVLKRNNIRAGFIGNPNTVSGNMNTAFGANTLLNPSGIRNVGIGTNVLPSNGTGNRNTAVGERSMFTNTTGSFNTAIGAAALYSNQSGDFNTAIGRNSLTSSAFGLYNTALGNDSGYSSTNGSNNIFIGYRAGYNEMGSNKLYIEYAALTTDSSQNNALIYGDFGVSPKVLRTNGQLQIGNPTVTGYAFPTSRGSNTQFLQTDGAGATSWAAIPVNTVLPYANTGASTGIYTIALTQYTIRVYNSVSEVRLPSAVGNIGKIFIVIGSNGIGSKTFSTAGGVIYDDVTNASISVINPNERYSVQSDGTDWIVIGR